MPLHNTGYRAWDGEQVSQWSRWLTICTMGVRRAYKSKWMKRLMLAALLPLLYCAIPFFLFEQSSRDPTVWRAFSGFVRGMPQAEALRETLGALPRNPTPEQFDTLRHQVWSYLLLVLMRYPQAFLIVLAVGIVAPPLISQDLRTRAYLIYFARPITRLEYIVGKFGVVAFFLLAICTLPGLLLYGAAVLLSPSVEVVLTTWDLPLRIIVGSACMIVPTTLVALAFSSLTQESRYAGFAWFAMWIIGHVTYSALYATGALYATRQGISEFNPGWRVLTSPYQILGSVQSYIFGLEGSDSYALQSFLLLVAVSIISLVILFRRVTAPMRV